MPLLDINQYVADRNGNNNAYQFFLEVIQNSQSTPNNTTNITVNHYALGRNGWGFSGFTTPASYITVGGVLRKTTTVASIPTNGTKTLIGTWTDNVEHLGDGTLSLSVSARFAPNTTAYGYVPKENTLSGTVQPTTIPRASDISVSNYTISNTTGSISYSITSKADFYHIIAWELNGTTNTSGATRINNTTQSFTISNQTLLNALPTQVSGSLSITVTTYSNSACTNLVGSKTASATITINTTSIKPSCTLGNIGINYTPHNSITVPVAGYSKVQSSFTATPGYGASGTITYFSASHGDLATASSNSASGTVISKTIPSNTSNYTYTLTAYAKDSRGAVGTTVTKTITVYGYQSPSATLNAYRTATNAAADTTLDGAGGYVYVTFSGTFRSSINSQNAIVSTSCTYSGGISGTATDGSHYTLGIDKNVTFTLTVTDRVSSSTAVVSVSAVKYPLDLYDEGNGTVGVGLGTIAQASFIVSGLPLKREGKTASGAEDFIGVATSALSATTATTATKLGTSTVGGTATPIYLNSGAPTSVATPTSGAWFGGIPKVSSAGVMEIGKYIDFHDTNTTTVDNSARLFVDGTTLKISGTSPDTGTILTQNNWASLTYQSSMIIARSSAATITSTTSNYFYKIVLSTSTTAGSASSLFSIENGGIKVLVAGKYKISASAYFQSNSSGCLPSVYIRSSSSTISDSSSSATGMGTELAGTSLPATTAAMPVTCFPMLVSITANTYIYLVARPRQAAGQIVCNNNMTFLQIEYEG